jgi:hypothetical protein
LVYYLDYYLLICGLFRGSAIVKHVESDEEVKSFGSSPPQKKTGVLYHNRQQGLILGA